MQLSWSRLGRLARKELRETLRDRRTILTLLLMPLLVYPLLSMALNRFLLSASPAQEGYIVGTTTEAEGRRLQALLEDPRSRPPDAILDASGGKLARFQVVASEPLSAVDALAANQLDAAVEWTDPGEEGQPAIKVFAFAGDERSLSARRILVERLQWYRLAEATERLKRLTAGTDSFEVRAAVIGSAETTSMLGTVIPLVLVLMTITGAVYPAIDLTAGERERGTMEALMASPVPRAWVLVAKYVAVVTVALLTAVMNLAAMYVTLAVTGLLPLLVGETGGGGWLAMLQVLGLLVLFSGFFSAVLLSLTSFAKSFKEAQAYLIPIMLLSLAPAMLSLMPGIELAGPLAVLPLINIVLLARDVLSASVDPFASLVAIATTLAYAAAALGVAAKLFGSDAVTRTSEQSIGSLLRRPDAGTLVPSVAEASMVVAVLLPVSFLVVNGLSQWLQSGDEPPGMTLQLVFNGLGLCLAFGAVPLAATWLGRHRFVATYRFHHAPWAAYAGAVVASLGAWAIAHELIVVAQQLGLAVLDAEKLEQARSVIEQWKTVSPWVILVSLAVAPAVVEEACFRGYLFSAFSRRLTGWQTVVVTALLFGIFHVLAGRTLLIERLLPSTFLGLLIGWLAYRSGSVLPGMLLHLLHNGLLEMVARYHERFDFLADSYETTDHLPLSWLAAATGCLVIGLGLIWAGTRPRSAAASPDEQGLDA